MAGKKRSADEASERSPSPKRAKTSKSPARSQGKASPEPKKAAKTETKKRDKGAGGSDKKQKPTKSNTFGRVAYARSVAAELLAAANAHYKANETQLPERFVLAASMRQWEFLSRKERVTFAEQQVEADTTEKTAEGEA